MERMTQQNAQGVWTVPAEHVTQVEHEASGAAVARLAHYETMHAALEQQQAEMAAKLEQLRAAEKQNSVQFRELVGNKLLHTNMLAILIGYGL